MTLLEEMAAAICPMGGPECCRKEARNAAAVVAARLRAELDAAYADWDTQDGLRALMAELEGK